MSIKIESENLVAKEIAPGRFLYLDADGGWQVDKGRACNFETMEGAEEYASRLARLYPSGIFGVISRDR